MNSLEKGLLITLEGIEGAGKSSHIQFIAEQLQQSDRDVLLTREPGGTTLGEGIRDLLLKKNEESMFEETELLLMFAARAQHVKQAILPAINAGKIVICDGGEPTAAGAAEYLARSEMLGAAPSPEPTFEYLLHARRGSDF